MDYGAPTTRKRFVLVARCDGRPAAWPERTHDKDGADGLPKWRAAAEVIDWTQPCYSIFATKEDIKSRYGVTAVRPLADNTMRRVIRGVDKFVIKAISGEALAAAVNAKVEEYTAWQCAKLGRDINPSRLISMLMETGIKRVDLIEPAFVSLKDGSGTDAPQLARLEGTPEVIKGGYEDE